MLFITYIPIKIEHVIQRAATGCLTFAFADVGHRKQRAFLRRVLLVSVCVSVFQWPEKFGAYKKMGHTNRVPHLFCSVPELMAVLGFVIFSAGFAMGLISNGLGYGRACDWHEPICLRGICAIGFLGVRKV